MTDLVFPILNLNGSSGESLLEDHQATLDACRELIACLSRSMPHGRDYQVSPAGAYEKAREQHTNRIRAVETVKADIEALGLNIVEQMAERKR